MKERISHFNSAACYLKKGNEVLMIKFSTKWDQVYAPPGGKFEKDESPLDCVMREFYEETGLKLINPHLQGISYWNKSDQQGVIFLFIADEFEGDLIENSPEGELSWIKLEELQNINQFAQNEKFTSYLFKDRLFEGKFIFNEENLISEYKIREI